LPIAQPEPPAFGGANLSNCEREQIHLAGSIQPHGALLVVREFDQVVLQASANAAQFLGGCGKLQGKKLRALGGNLWECAHCLANERGERIPIAIRCHLGDLDDPLNALLHRTSAGELVIELERAGPQVDFSSEIELALQSIIGSTTLSSLCDTSARLVKEIAGYDRVMVYRFDAEGHGEVFAETRKPELEAFLGNRYPASDIPQIARRLYERNRVRLLADINYTPAPMEPRLSPISGQELDMSMCFLRSASPIHIQYLKNMGVGATLVVSLMVGNRLWGLISCHHYSPRYPHFEMRAICELLGEVIGTRISALESFVHGQGELSVRRLEQKMVESISRDGDWRSALFDNARSLLLPLAATGAALLFEDQIQTTGDVPGTSDIRALGRWIFPKMKNGDVFVTANLGADEPAFSALTGVASGVVATRVSSNDDEMLIWFRKERVRTVTWGGNPLKPPSSGDDPSELSPRRSFAQWHQVVEGTSDPWTAADQTSARMIGASVTDVIVQFRAVRIVIAKDQLDQVRRQIRASELQVLVADADGRILESNPAFEKLVGAKKGALRTLDDLPGYFVDSVEVAVRLDALRSHRRPWRGEAQLQDKKTDGSLLHVRADAVIAGPDRTLGFVLLLTDLADRKIADAARRRFQDGILTSHRPHSSPMASAADLKAQKLISNVIENAQLAALEITDGANTTNMSSLLESIRISVARAAEVLEYLSFDIEDAGSAAKPEA